MSTTPENLAFAPVGNEQQQPVLPVPPAVINAGGELREAKFPDVNKFDGNPKSSFEFLSKLQVYFYLQPQRFASDLAKCYYVGLRCESAAALWFNSVLIGPDAADIITNYTRFVDEFKLTFDDPTRVHDAERQLLTMRQGRRSVARMIPEFKINVFIAGWQNENLFRIFLNTLNDNVRDELLKETRPATLQLYMDRAIAIDRQLFERQLDRKNRGGPRTSVAIAESSSDDMQLDALQVGRRLFAEERQRRIQNNLCLYCGGAGHRVTSCPSKN